MFVCAFMFMCLFIRVFVCAFVFMCLCICVQVFAGQEYVSLSSLSLNVPLLSCAGISKRFMVPGWRLGWIIVHDRNHAFRDEIRPGLSRLAMKLLGPCTLVQAALPHMLRHTPQDFHERTMQIFKRNAELVFRGLNGVPGLSPVMPAGSMYMMVSVHARLGVEKGVWSTN